MSGHVWSVFRYELRRNLSRKGFLFTSFGIPLILFAAYFLVQAFTANQIEEHAAELEFNLKGIDRAGYIDLTGILSSTGDLADILIRYDDEEQARVALDAGEIDVYYILPADFLESGKAVEVAPNFAVNKLTDEPIQQLIYNQVVDDVDLSILLRLRDPASVERIELQHETDDEVVQNEGADFTLVYAFVIVFMLAIFGTNGYLMQSVIEEKETRLIEILISSVRPAQLLMGKILALGLLGLFQVGAYIGTILVLTRLVSDSSSTTVANSFLADIDIPVGQLPILLVYFVLGYLMFAAGFSAIGALSNSMSEGPNLAAVLIIPAIAPFYFSTIFIENPNVTLAIILSLIPITAPVSMIMRITLTDVPLIQLILSLASLTVTVAFMIWAAGRLFHINTLLAGHMPKIREIPKLIWG
jgi:ABC-2 type transport system permease protein